MTNSKTLYAVYQSSTDWDLEELGIDLDKVVDWYIKWDTLRVKRTEDSEWEAIEPTCHAEVFDHKHPDQIWLGGDRLED